MKTTPGQIDPSLSSIFAGRRRWCVWMLLPLLLLGTAWGQVNPDSTRTPGKGSIKSRNGTPDSLRTEESIRLLPEDSLTSNPEIPDSLIGPVRAKTRKGRSPKLKVASDRPLPDPKIAVRRALLLPGWGQIYNRSWAKLPIVYGGFAVFGWLIVDNNQQYQLHRRIAVCKGDSTCDDATLYPDFALFDINSVIAVRDGFRRNRDFNVILSALWYTLQAVDAYVTAHLRGFNVSDDLSLHFKPNMMVDPRRRNHLLMGASISLKLRR
ncbi:MAG: DUF5683 domain-containing protein [Bacteroidota bacterium]